MPTLSDARFDALRGQGFTGATSDMLLQWLQTFSGITPPADEYVNPELAGGAPSGPVDGSNPPTAHNIGFNTCTSRPIDNGDGTFNWIANEELISGRSFLSYVLDANHPGLEVGDKVTVSYDVFQHPGGESPTYAAAIAVTGTTGVDFQYGNRTAVEGEWRRVSVSFTITDAVYAAQVRVGVGTTTTVVGSIETASPTAVVTRVAQAGFPKTVPDGWKTMLLALTGLPEESYHRNDYWYAQLGSLGFTGSLNDRELAFWLAGGDPTGGIPFLVTDNDEPLTTDGGLLILAG